MPTQISSAVASAARTSSATGSRPRTPIANRRSSSRQAVQVTSTPCVSTVRASPEAGSISSNSPGHDHAIAADRLDHGGVRPGGRPAGPAELHLAAPQRARVARDGIDQRQLGAVPGTLARALGDDCDDRAVTAPGRLPDVQVDGRGGRELAARDVQHVERAAAIALALARIDERNPIRQLGLGAECARAERVGLLGALAGDEQQDAGAVRRPLVVLDHPGRLGQRTRLAQDAQLERVELCDARASRGRTGT